MAIDSRIALAAQVPDTNTAIRGGLLNADTFTKMREDKKNAPLRNKLFQDKAATSELQLDNDTKLSELKSMAIGASDALSSYEQFGKQGVIDSFTNRINQGASVEGGRGMVDTEEALAYVSDPIRTDEEVKNYLTQAQQGAMKGIDILSGNRANNLEAPSNVREYEFYNSLDDDKKADYLNVKRSGSVIDLGGGGKAVRDASGNVTTLVSPEDATDREADKASAISSANEQAKIDAQVESTERVAESQAKIANMVEGAKLEAQDLGNLKASQPMRVKSIEKAEGFLEAFESGARKSGSGRSAANFAPIGTWTDQGEFDELFNAFAEVAARQSLKASGETKPTDADVQGMKKAMFGIGRDEQVNIELLKDYLDVEKSLSKRVNSGGRELTPKPVKLRFDAQGNIVQ